MTLVLEIVTLVFLSVGKGIHSMPLALSFHVFALVDITVVVGGGALAVRFSSH